MRNWILVALLLCAVPLTAQDHQHHQHQPQGSPAASADGELPNGWQARFDRANASLSNVRFHSMDGGYHVVLGPSGIFYDPAQRAEGRFTARATFTQNRASQHPEAYGIFIGGRNLDAPSQEYVYFLVRQDGRFLIKRRAGAETPTLREWTEHAAVRRTTNGSAATNELAVEVGAQHTRFLVNGTEVARVENTAGLHTDGVVGYRINHNLDLHLSRLTVQRAN
jgi:hypothetical protein